MSTADQVNKKLDALWLKHLPTLRARLDSIQDAIDAIERGDLSHSVRDRAAHDAHKLAGSLGTFGILSGSEIARELERLLAHPETTLAQIVELFTSLKEEINKRSC